MTFLSGLQTNQPIDQAISQPTNQPINKSSKQSISLTSPKTTFLCPLNIASLSLSLSFETYYWRWNLSYLSTLSVFHLKTSLQGWWSGLRCWPPLEPTRSSFISWTSTQILQRYVLFDKIEGCKFVLYIALMLLQGFERHLERSWSYISENMLWIKKTIVLVVWHEMGVIRYFEDTHMRILRGRKRVG